MNPDKLIQKREKIISDLALANSIESKAMDLWKETTKRVKDLQSELLEINSQITIKAK